MIRAPELSEHMEGKKKGTGTERRRSMKLGFIGLGNMASAVIGGILKEGIAAPQDIIGSAKTEKTAKEKAEEFGIEACTDNKRVAEQADVLVLAVKPQFFPEVIAEIRDVFREEALAISVAAGKTIRYIEEQFSGGESKRGVKLVRCMPNTPALVLEGCTGYCINERVSREEKAFAEKLFSSFGKAIEVPERLMDTVGSVSGSSPAFVFMFIEALADGAVAEGMPRKQAIEFAAQAVLGSAKLVLESGLHPEELKDMVCSPGGTTIQGVRTLEKGGLRGAVMDAVIACAEKSRGL